VEDPDMVVFPRLAREALAIMAMVIFASAIRKPSGSARNKKKDHRREPCALVRNTLSILLRQDMERTSPGRAAAATAQCAN
jgi:hypothetical protein